MPLWPPRFSVSAGGPDSLAALMWWSLAAAVVAAVALRGRCAAALIAAWLAAAATLVAVYLVVLDRPGGEVRGYVGTPPTMSATQGPLSRCLQSFPGAPATVYPGPEGASATAGAAGPPCAPEPRADGCPAALPAAPRPPVEWQAMSVEELFRDHVKPDYDAVMRMELFLRQEMIAAPEANIASTVMPLQLRERPGPMGGVW